MKARSAADIERLALGRGAEVEIAGRTFNASQQRLAAKPPAPPALEPTPAPALATLTHEDVVRIAAQMLADSERRTAQALAEQANALTLAITKALRESAPAPGKKLVRQQVKVVYDDEDRITGMTVTPVYEDAKPATRADS